jgi:electron transfer flavoprotein beta subunit
MAETAVPGIGRPGGPPLVVACLAPADLHPEVDALTGEVLTDTRRADLSAPEAAALEYALRAGEAWGADVLAVSAGPPETDSVLAGIAALGVEVVRVERDARRSAPGSGPTGLDPAEIAGDQHAVASALASAILTRGQPTLVICGDRSARAGTGAVPGHLAVALGCVAALGLVSIEIGEPGRVTVQRRLDGGWREALEVTGPAVLSVEAAGVRLRRAPLAAALEAAGRPVPVLGPSHGPGPVVHFGGPRPYRPLPRVLPAPAGDARERLLHLTGALSHREPPRVLGPLTASEAAREVLDYLDRQGVAGPATGSG